MDHNQECLVPVLKVCKSLYCTWCAEIDPAFKLNMELSQKVLGGDLP